MGGKAPGRGVRAAQRASQNEEGGPWPIRPLLYNAAIVAASSALLAGSNVTLANAGPTRHHGHGHRPGCWTHRCDKRADRLYARKHRPKCSNRNPRACVEELIRQRHIGEPEAAWLLRIPGCESSWNPELPPNSAGATGLFQFLPSTWAGTPYGDHSIYSAFWQSRAAAWLYEKDGGGSEWVCV